MLTMIVPPQSMAGTRPAFASLLSQRGFRRNLIAALATGMKLSLSFVMPPM